MRLIKLQELDKVFWKIRAKNLKDKYKKVDEVLYYEGLLLALEVIQIELINYYQNKLLVSYFGIDKI